MHAIVYESNNFRILNDIQFYILVILWFIANMMYIDYKFLEHIIYD